MDHSRIIEALQGIIDHLSNKQGNEFKSALDLSRMPKEIESIPGMDDEKPKGLKIESVELMGKPGVGVEEVQDGDDEMDDEELEELLRR